MEFNKLINFIHTHSKILLDQYLQPDKKQKGYICPICNNGNGDDGDGIREDPNNPGHYKCFKCGFYGDIIDIVGKKEGVTNCKKQIQRVKEIFNLNIEEEISASINPLVPQKVESLEEKRKNALKNKNKQYESLITKSKLKFFRWKGHSYLNERGISSTTALQSKVGYIQNYNDINQGIIFYTTSAGFNIRNIDPNCSKKNRYRKAGVDLPFNILDIKKESCDPLYIVEGEIDALSILEIGYEAISLNGLSKEALIFSLVELNINRPLILMLDNDKAGKEAQEKLFQEIKKNNFKVYQSKILTDEYKDANDYLCHNKAEFKKQIKKEIKKSINSEKNLEPEDILIQGNSFNILESFKTEVINHNIPSAISTGFSKLDEEILDGGLYEGLYIIGAASSTGKTSFVLQMSDHIASTGKDIMILSLEMNAINLIAKSMSRLSFLLRDKNNRSLTTREILNTGQPSSKISFQYFNSLVESYQKQISNNLTIIEDNYRISTDELENILISFYKEKKNYPVVIIDYFQILPPPSCLEKNPSEKRILDYNINKLKEISKKYKIPIILISSFNRESYRNGNNPSLINYASFNGSSSIEYRADVLIALETVKDIKINNLDKCRYLKLKVLKNRNGNSDQEILYRYYLNYNYFEETEDVNKIGAEEISPKTIDWEWPYQEYEKYLR